MSRLDIEIYFVCAIFRFHETIVQIFLNLKLQRVAKSTFCVTGSSLLRRDIFSWLNLENLFFYMKGLTSRITDL